MLIFGKVRKKPKPQGNPPWLTWSVTALIVYMIYNQYTDRKNSEFAGKLQQRLPQNQAVQPVPINADTKNMEAATKVQPEQTLSEKITIRGDIEGRGIAASCGHLLQINYDELAPDNSDFKAKENISLEIKAGLKASSLWHEAITGMKMGGVRQINVKAADIYNDKQLSENSLKSSDLLEYKIELKSLQPTKNSDEIDLQIIDNSSGEGETINCTKTAELQLTLWGIDGKKLYENDAENPLKSRIGYNDYFYGLDQTLLGMKVGGVRSAIIPPSYAKLSDEANKIFKNKIIENQMVIVQVKLLNIK
jgi:FKBP-type peptidyl-prolyl cis-trans isomerase